MKKIFMFCMSAGLILIFSELCISEEKNKKAADIQTINIFCIQVLPHLNIIPS